MRKRICRDITDDDETCSFVDPDGNACGRTDGLLAYENEETGELTWRCQRPSHTL